jgi:hypothetical protein
VSFALVLFLAIYLMILLSSNRQTAKNYQRTAYEKSFGDLRLTVQDRSDKNQNAHLISISKSGKTLVSNYRLPIEKYDLRYPLQIKNSKLIPLKENGYRVILFSTFDECCEESTDYVWFFKLNDKLNLVHVVDLSELTKNEADKLSFFGYKYAKLPYFKDAAYKYFIIPIEVTVGESIKISPLLNKSGIDLIKMSYEIEAEKRMATLNKTQNVDMLKKYKTELAKFKDTITEKNIPY